MTKPMIDIPDKDVLISDFSVQLGVEISKHNKIFYSQISDQVVEISYMNIGIDNKQKFLGLKAVSRNRFVSVVEEYVTPCKDYVEGYGRNATVVRRRHSINASTAAICLECDNFINELSMIGRVLTVPIPHDYKGKLTLPKHGYDERFLTYMPENAPNIDVNMNINEAKKIIDKIYEEFCFKEYDGDINLYKTNAIAHLLTPFILGLASAHNIVTPLFFYEANRPRCGKDYCANIVGILYEGAPIEDPVICSDTDNGNSGDELRKKITTAVISGRRRYHSSNNRGFIKNATFEGAITKREWIDRILGKNIEVSMPLEIVFSMSGNLGIKMTTDLSERCRFIRLHLVEENANERKFKNSRLHEWIIDNRELVLSALYALVREWYNSGKKKSDKIYVTATEWSEIVGSILEFVGYGNPSVNDDNVNEEIDPETADAKKMFSLCYKKFSDNPIEIKQIFDYIKGPDSVEIMDDELFPDIKLDALNDRPARTKFSLLMKKFDNREFGNILFKCVNSDVVSYRRKYRFIKKDTAADIKVIKGGSKK